MAWNPNIPTVTNRVQDDLDAIRGNFQHLDPLAQIVNELQTVSGLAPVANELQTVSGLAPVANELQTVSGLAPVANELQTVSGLAAYVQAILNSRIVEMGSNSNGEYVRWENGLQVCWFSNDPTPNFTARTEGAVSGYFHSANWTYPAAFIANPSVVAIGGGYAGSQAQTSLNTSIVNLSTTIAEIRLWAWNQVDANVTIFRIAIGRWK